MPTAARRKRSPLKVFLMVAGAAALVFVLAIGVTAFVTWRLAGQTPAWWHPANPSDPAVDASARSFENSVSDQVHRVRPATPTAADAPANAATWTMTLKEPDANAWLMARLENWLLNRNERVAWPAGASRPQVAFEPGKIRLGFEFKEASASKGRVLSVALVPSIDAQGALWLGLESISIGRFPIPGDAVSQGGAMIESRLPAEMQQNPDTARFIKALAGKSPLSDKAVAKLSDGRRVQMVRITPKTGELEIECRTLARE
jgi:hypothetical protein